QGTRELAYGRTRLMLLALLAGLLVGLGCLTRYAFGWLIIPVLLFLLVFGGPQRVILAAAALVVFAGVMAPWLVREFQVSGTPFGTATYTVLEGTPAFPEHRLQRSLDPDFTFPLLRLLTQKLIVNSRQVLAFDLPRLGGSWIAAFFLTGLLVNLRRPGAARVRFFAIFCIAVLTIAQAL